MKKRAGILFIALLCAGCNYPELSEDEIQELKGGASTETPNGGGTDLALNKTDIAATAAASTYTITVKSTGIWAAAVATGDTWCSLSDELGMGNGTITVNVLANTNTNTRSASIIVTNGTLMRTVTVTQKGGATDEKPTLTLDKTSISATAAAEDYTIDITSNSAWMATVTSGATWCRVRPASGTGNRTVTVQVEKNTSTSSRSATITITAGTLLKTVTVTQEDANVTALTLDITSISALSIGATHTIFVHSNSAWEATVSSGATWCTVSPTSGRGTELVMVNVSENTTTSSRSATITFTAGTLTKTLPVTQAAASISGFTETGGGLNFDMVSVVGGTTTLNSTNVNISSFAIGKYEVTEGLWEAVMGSNPSYNKRGNNYPVENVRWEDIQKFISALKAQTGKNYRLPTEAEWEYAAKGGQSTHNYIYSGSNTIGDVAWSSGNSGDRKHIVGTKAANELGIYDMSGNVSELCSDWFSDTYPYSTTNPTGASSGPGRVDRGGDWYNSASCAVSFRVYTSSTPNIGASNSGFRLVLPL